MDNTKKTESNPRDAEFVDTIANTLTQSLDEIDDLTAQRLANARAAALSSPRRINRTWVPMSVAASVIALLMAPVVLHYQSVDVAHENDPFSQDITVSQDIPPSAQELDDMEMLMTLEDDVDA